jgi:accessory gene regulator B
LKYAPAGTESKPIVNKKLRKKLKIKSAIVLLIFYLISLILYLNTYSTIIITMALLQCICITPFAYKIFNRRYNNYEES